MSGEDGRLRAERYREIATRLTRLAAQMQFHDARQQLCTIAEQFERMAEFAERWEDVEE